jgi:hypothetical protein
MGTKAGYMPKLQPDSLREVEAALARYVHEVQQSKIAPTTKRTYIRHAETFVRWLNDDFTPGAHTA